MTTESPVSLAVEFRGDKQNETDALLTLAVKSGDVAAFGELSRRHSKRIKRHIYRMLRNLEDAEDVMQDSLFKAFLHLDQFRGTSSFSTWLTRIAINSTLMVLRKRRGHVEISYDKSADFAGIVEPWEFTDPSLDPERLCARHETEELLQRAIHRLPESCRTVAEMYLAEGSSNSEIAEALGITVPATKSRLLRARGMLRASLLRKADSRRTALILTYALLLSSCLTWTHSAFSQIGSGSPDASARVQVQVQAAAGQEGQAAPQSLQPRQFVGQALDQDSAVLAKVPPDPIFKTDPFRPVLKSADREMNTLRETERLAFGATYTAVNQTRLRHLKEFATTGGQPGST